MSKDTITIRLHRPSVKELSFFFISGALVSVPLTLLIEQFANPFLTGFSAFDVTILTVAISAPFVEEFAKAYPLFYRHGETERSILLLGFLTGLGFGVIEFFLYIFVYQQPVLTRLPIVLFHATNTSVTAYGIAAKKPIQYYLLAIALHSLINYSAMNFSGQFDVFLITYLLALVGSYVFAWNLYEKTEERIVE